MRASYVANPNLAPGLLPYDLTRGGSPFHFNGTGAIKQRGYARSLQTPLNENLLVSSAAGEGGLSAEDTGASASIPLHAGARDQVNVGLQQALGRRVVLDADYFWKKTMNAADLCQPHLERDAGPVVADDI